MMVSLSATCESVKCGSPRERLLQTNTMAVQGAAASRISPATYESTCSAGSHGRNTWPINSQAKNAIEKGFTAQFTSSVTPMPRQ